MRDKIFSWIVGHPLWTALLSILFVIGAGYGAQNLKFNDSYKAFFAEDDPSLVGYEKVQAIFSKTDNVSFYLVPKNGNVFTPEVLSAIKELTNEAWQIPHSSRVDSLTNFQHSWSEEDDLTVEDLLPDYQELTPQVIAKAKQIALNEPLLVHKLISKEGHVSVVNVTVNFSGADEQAQIVAKSRAIKQSFQQQYPNIEIMLSGIVFMNQSFADLAVQDNVTLVPLMFLMVIILMIALLKSVTGTFSTIIIVITSIIATMGLTGWIGIDLTGPTASAPIMILTLAVADCIHVLSSMIFEMRQGKNKPQALLESLKINFKPVVLTSVTTAIGFLSMNFSDSPPFRDLGNIVAIGVMLACIFSLVLFPALLMLLPVRVKVDATEKQTLMLKLANFVTTKRKLLLPAMTLVMLGLVALLPRNTLNDNFVEYFDDSTQIRQTTKHMQKNLSGIILMEVAIDTGIDGGVSGKKYLQNLEAFSDWFKTQPEVDHITTLSDTFNRLNKNMHGDDPSYYKLPDSQELAAQYLLLYEMSLPYGLDLNNQINVSKSSTRVLGTLKNLSSLEMQDLERRINNWFTIHAPNYQVMVTGPDLMFAHIGQNNIKSMLSGTAIALVLISGLIGLALKSMRFAIISLIPNLAPAAMGFGAWYLLNGEVGLGLSVVAGMTLGIVVDYTVHFMSKYLHAKQDKGANTHEAVRYAFANVGKALWVTTLVLVAGFTVMAQSDFKMNADMGFLTAVTITIALIVDFFFLPPLLMQLDKDEQESDEAQSLSPNSI